ncbi:MAG: tetratricopeptide repeat protein [Deltaproteobacteria bacterium]|nr:tetratricopeptide repeat protein [Deltaproteobacteria bacterium]
MALTRHFFIPAALSLAAASILFYGCQGTAPLHIPVIENKSLSTAEEYIDIALKSGDVSVETLLVLTENYFDEESAISRDRFLAYEEQQRLYLAGKTRAAPAAPVTDHSRLIRGLRAVQERFPDKDGMDGVAYALGYALFESGKPSEAITAFEKFLEKYDSSRLATEANFRLAELYFDESRLVEAEEAYSKLLRRRTSAFHNKATYKLGWTHYRLDEYDRAFSYFVRLLDSSKIAQADREAAETLGTEAENDAIKALTHLKGTAIETLMTGIKGSPKAPAMTLALGRVFLDQGRTVEAAQAFALFLKLFPENRAVPVVYMEMAKTADVAGDKASAIEFKKKLIENYGPSTDWYRRNFEGLGAEERASMASALLDLADHYRELAKTDPGMRDKAIDAYALFVVNFGTNAAAEAARYNLADLLFESERYIEAALQYSDLTLLLRNKPEGEAAAFTCLISLELTAASNKPFNKTTYRQIAGDVTLYYSTYHMDNPRAEAFMFKAADAYAAAGMHTEAKDVLTPLTRGKNPYAAFIKLGDIQAAAMDIDGALDSYEKAYAIKKDASLNERLASMHYLRALEHEKLGAYDDALKRYMRAFELGAPSKTSDDALLRAARLQMKRGDDEGFERVLALGKRLMPLSNATYTVIVENAADNEQKGRTKSAADRYNEAAIHAHHIGKTEERDKLVIKAAALYNVAAMYPMTRSIVSARISRGGFASTQAEAKALLLMAEAEEKAGDISAAKKTYASIVSSGADGSLKAPARLSLAEIKLSEYLGMKITEPLASSIKAKEAAMKTLLDEYAAIANEQYAELLPRCFYSMGLALENYESALLNSPRPQDLTEEEKKEYTFLLEEKTYPIEEEAVKAYKGALKTSASLSLTKDAALPGSLALKRLAELRPAMYKRTIEPVEKSPLFDRPVMMNAD